MTRLEVDGAVHSSVRLWLRLEGLTALLVATYLYAHEGGSWLAFAVLFFAPDVSFAGYIAGRELAQRSTTSRTACHVGRRPRRSTAATECGRHRASSKHCKTKPLAQSETSVLREQAV